MKTIYTVTGVDRYGKRFRKGCGTNSAYALAHNVWRGSVWAQDYEEENLGTLVIMVPVGKKRRIHTWTN